MFEWSCKRRRGQSVLRRKCWCFKLLEFELSEESLCFLPCLCTHIPVFFNFKTIFIFLFSDFVGGTLGLAWVASPQVAKFSLSLWSLLIHDELVTLDTAGGVCQVYQRYNVGPRGWVFRSLNTGIVTLVNYGNRVLSIFITRFDGSLFRCLLEFLN